MRRWLLPMLCAVALVLTACGGAGEGTSTTSTTAGQTVRPGAAVGPNIVVSYVQSALTELGYLDQVNGRFDAATADALRRFQRAEHLPADGELDARTALALATKSPATKRYAVLALQTELT
ncbi:MAG TPA: peptidoglycan-binding domain-containing protein, partial [Acidimicrobiales bacterium]